MTVSPLDPTPGKNNPIRVPAPVEWAEGDPALQAGVPRLIHVIGNGPQIVGTVVAIQEQQMIATSTQPGDETITTADADGTYVDAVGNSFQYRKGDRLPVGVTTRDDAAVLAAAPPPPPAPASPPLSDEDVNRIADRVAGLLFDGLEQAARMQAATLPPGFQTPEDGANRVQTPETPTPKPETAKERRDREAAEKAAADAAKPSP